MSELKYDSCGRYVPKTGDEIYWRFKESKGKQPFKRGYVSTVKSNGLVAVGEPTPVGIITNLKFLDLAEVEIR